MFLLFGLNESVDGLMAAWTNGRDEGPVLFVGSILFDPFFEKGDLLWVEGRFVGLRSRHDVVRIGRDDAFDEFGGIGITFDNGGLAIGSLEEGKLLAVEAERILFWFASGAVGTVTMVAILRENWLHVVVKIDDLREFGKDRLSKKSNGEKALHHLG